MTHPQTVSGKSLREEESLMFPPHVWTLVIFTNAI